MIKAKVYRTPKKKGLLLYLSGDVNKIKIENKSDLLVTTSEDGKELTMRAVNDIK